MDMNDLIACAKGEIKADLVLTNARIINVFSGEIVQGNIAVKNGYIAGMGNYDGELELDMKNKYVCPGFIDAHVHIESSMASVTEFARARLPLPIAGLMSYESLPVIQEQMESLLLEAKKLGSELPDPFMTLSFLALPVIPELKITDKGLVDVSLFKHVSLFV